MSNLGEYSPGRYAGYASKCGRAETAALLEDSQRPKHEQS
jgi:hypothetical protein